jgi:hypothetical protein
MIHSPRTKSDLLPCAAGILTAALFFELGLRPFVAGWNQPEGQVRTIRSYSEGFSAAHFEADGLGTFGNRLTGNPPLAGAPEGLIVGDSHVIAQAVRDEETMGAVIERLSRSAGHPLNVRQYGWSSANAPTYLASAGALLRARNPAWVAVVLNSSNIGVYALTTTQNWRMEVDPDGSFRLIDMRRSQAVGRTQNLRREIGRSALALALWHRVGIGATENASVEHLDPRLVQETARVPRATVLGLKKAYESRLLIVYTPAFFGTRYDSLDPLEQEVLALCEQNGVACISVREGLARERYEQFRLSRGFHNTAPGAGHFNAVGHRLIGTEIWRYLSGHSLPHT